MKKQFFTMWRYLEKVLTSRKWGMVPGDRNRNRSHSEVSGVLLRRVYELGTGSRFMSRMWSGSHVLIKC